MSALSLPADPNRLARRAVAAATIGNALEFYDFITYAFFAIQIGHAFFPAASAYASLMLSLATFGAGFITRPIGALVIGSWSDRVGRRPAMMASFTLMGAAIIAIAIIPPYAKIGIAAPILAIVARLAQGFSLGGEVGPTTAYLLEAAPIHRRGLSVSWQGASQALASVAAALVGFGLSAVLSHTALEAYGWRIAFLLGAVTLPFGLWIRSNLPEPPDREPARADRPADLGATLRANIRIIVLGMIVLAGGTIATYIFNYLITFTQNTLHRPPIVAFATAVLSGVTTLAATLFGGWLSDKVGRRPMMIWPRLANLVLILPVFWAIVEARSLTALLLGPALLALLGSLSGGPFYAALSESLPRHIRGRTIATMYAVAITIFGGTTQPVVTWLLHVTGDPMALAWCLVTTSGAGTIAIAFILESAPVRLGLLETPAASAAPLTP